MVTDESPETLTVTLARPVTHNGRPYETLTLRRPLVRDLIAANRQAQASGPTAGDAALVAACADVPFTAIGQLDAADFRRILREGQTAGFFSDEDDDDTPTSDAPSSS